MISRGLAVQYFHAAYKYVYKKKKKSLVVLMTDFLICNIFVCVKNIGTWLDNLHGEHSHPPVWQQTKVLLQTNEIELYLL